MPAGVDGCGQATVKRWTADRWRYPPYQHKLQHLIKTGSGKLRPPVSTEREILMGFERDRTLSCMTAAERRSSPTDFEDKRCSLLGNSFHALTVAWLISHLLVKWKQGQRPVTVKEISDPAVPFNLSLQGPSGSHEPDCWMQRLKTEGELASSRYYLDFNPTMVGTPDFWATTWSQKWLFLVPLTLPSGSGKWLSQQVGAVQGNILTP